MKQQIKSNQLLMLMILFVFGSTLIVGMSFEVGQDSWIVTLISMLGGLLLYIIYSFLHKMYPDEPLTSYSILMLGRGLGYIISIGYISYFLYLAARVLRDFSTLMLITILKGTPLIFIMILFIVVVMFCASLGIETLGRTGEIMFPIVMISGFLLLVFVYLNGIPEIENLQPPLEKGWKPILQQVFPKGITFPYGELVVFTMLFPFLNRRGRVGKLGVQAILFSTLALLFANLTILSSLGPDLAKHSNFPLLDTISMVNIQGIIQRLDPIVIVIVVLAGFFKISIFFLAAFIGINDILPSIKKKKRRYPVLVLGVILLIVSLMMSDNYIEHLYIGIKLVPTYLHIPMQVIIPLLLLLIGSVKRSLNNKNQYK